MLSLLLGMHILMTFKTRGVQRHMPRAIKLSLKDSAGQGDVSPFQALAASLASTIGTGNIIGLGTAVALGGAGAVFWCWIMGVLGIATKYAESLLAVRYRVKKQDGSTAGGAMYILERRLRLPLSAKFFALCTVLTSIGIGSGVQINAISQTLTTSIPHGTDYTAEILGLHLPTVPFAVGLTAAIIVTMVIFGGVKSIARTCEYLVPFMTVLYLLGCIIILIANRSSIPEALSLIVRSAFSVKSTLGGISGYTVGAAVRYGISRGLFSNEAGIGSSPIISASARCDNPTVQALIASTAVFWDTVILCFVTGLVIVSSIIKGGIDVRSLSQGELTYAVFSQIPYVGRPILMFGLIAFAFSTILGWSFYGEQGCRYLFGERSVGCFRIFYILTLVVAPLVPLDTVWAAADILNALMALPNLTALFLLRNEVTCRKEDIY